jgi:hypothetical protein
VAAQGGGVVVKKRRWRTPILVEVAPHMRTFQWQVTALSNDARIAALGISHLRDDKSEHPRHRPKTIDSPLRRDAIAQSVAIRRALAPKKNDKWVIGKVCENYGVSRAYVYRILQEMDPKRWEAHQAFAATLMIGVLDHETGLLRDRNKKPT